MKVSPPVCLSVPPRCTGRSYNISLLRVLRRMLFISWLVICKELARPLILNLDCQITSHTLRRRTTRKDKKRTCGIASHFIDSHGSDHSALKFMFIDQHHRNVRQRENFWIGTLIINLRGLNDSHDFVQLTIVLEYFLITYAIF